MVKFVPGSEAAVRVREVSQQAPLRLEALEPVVEQLEARTGLPLTVTQLTSGDWVVLRMPREGHSSWMRLVRSTRPYR